MGEQSRKEDGARRSLQGQRVQPWLALLSISPRHCARPSSSSAWACSARAIDAALSKVFDARFRGQHSGTQTLASRVPTLTNLVLRRMYFVIWPNTMQLGWTGNVRMFLVEASDN